METKEYAKAYKEVVEILRHVPAKNLKVIPKEKIMFYIKNMDDSYDYTIDETKDFKGQEISHITEAILATIFRDYWATPYQKEKILSKEKSDRQKSDEMMNKNYNPDDIFKEKVKNSFIDEEISKENSINIIPQEESKKNFFRQLINFIKSYWKNK